MAIFFDSLQLSIKWEQLERAPTFADMLLTVFILLPCLVTLVIICFFCRSARSSLRNHWSKVI